MAGAGLPSSGIFPQPAGQTQNPQAGQSDRDAMSVDPTLGLQGGATYQNGATLAPSPYGAHVMNPMDTLQGGMQHGTPVNPMDVMQGGMQHAQPAQPAQPPNIFNAASQGINQGITTAGMETMYRPATIAGTDLTQYTNPYETQVVNQSLQDLERARQMQANQLGAQASGAGAFGGSRQALMESELGRNFLDQSARTASGLRQTGYNNAMTAAQSDISTGLQGSQNRLNAANQLGNLSNLGFGMGMDLNAQAAQQGALEQGVNQLLLDAAKNQYAGYIGAPTQSLNYMNQAMGVTPTPTTTTQTKNPGLFDYLTLGAGLAGSIYGK